MAIDITEALLRLKNQVGQKTEELEALNFAIAELEGRFAPEFAELEEKRIRNQELIAEKETLIAEKNALLNPVTPIK